jgi:hypothetical protein
MKDTFGSKLSLADTVLYCTNSSAGGGTTYVIGSISKLYPCHPIAKGYYPPDRIAVKVKKTNKKLTVVFEKDPIINASNVVLLKGLK